jgi:ketol-acid reductoisomerase
MFKNDTLLMMGYGTQGRGQALNLRDNGMNVIVGVRKGGKGSSWEIAVADGWVEGKNLFTLEDAMPKATVYMYLLSDAGQKQYWPTIQPHLTKGKTLYVAHGFSLVFSKDTGVIAPPEVDVILVAPKGSGTTVRNLFLEGRGINGSVAVYQDKSGQAKDRAFGLGVAVGCGYLYETTFQKETYSDLVGERGVLMGMVQGAFQAQYEVLRSKGHSPSEAFNETVEEATQSLWPLVGAKGMDWMFGNCSTTAQRGALDWYPRFHVALKPVFEKLYAEVENGNECRRTLEVNSKPDYKVGLEKELQVLRDSEMWRAGVVVRQLRPENQ